MTEYDMDDVGQVQEYDSLRAEIERLRTALREIAGGEMSDIVERLRRMATCVYIAVDKSVADDLAAGMREAAAEITGLQGENERLRARVEAEQNAHIQPLADAIRLQEMYRNKAERLRADNERLRAALATTAAEYERALRCSCEIANRVSDECTRLGKCKERLRKLCESHEEEK